MTALNISLLLLKRGMHQTFITTVRQFHKQIIYVLSPLPWYKFFISDHHDLLSGSYNIKTDIRLHPRQIENKYKFLYGGYGSIRLWIEIKMVYLYSLRSVKRIDIDSCKGLSCEAVVFYTAIQRLNVTIQVLMNAFIINKKDHKSGCV